MKHFHRDIILDVPDSVYCPEEDSQLAAEWLDKQQDLASKKVLEIGCGSGLLSIIAAKAGAIVTATDINPQAVLAANQNAKNNDVEINCFQSDLFQNVKGKFDLIMFNSPYLPSEEKDHRYSGGPSGREVISKFIADVLDYLDADGRILLVFSTLSGESEVKRLVEKRLKIINEKRLKVPWEEIIILECQLSSS